MTLLFNTTALWVAAGLSLLAATCAVVGTFALLRGRALVGDAVAHAVLPGVCLAFLIQGTKAPLGLLLGAFATGYSAQLATDWLPRKTQLKTDTAIALVLSVFFGAGTVLLSYIQGQGLAGQTGLDRFLFGQAAALSLEELKVFALFALGVGLVIAWAYPALKLLAFDAAYSKVRGLPVRGLEVLLTTLTVVAVVLGIQAVGVVLLSALLITPVAAGRFWKTRLVGVIAVAALVATVAVWIGVWISATWSGMPTGPWIVVALTLVALASLALAPERGVVARYIRRRRRMQAVREENLLKGLYHVEAASPVLRVDAQTLADHRPALATAIHRLLPRLIAKGEAILTKEGITLTPSGRAKAKALVRRHRLWELYLTQRLTLPPDRVHADAEVVEHVLSPDLEAELEAQLAKL